METLTAMASLPINNQPCNYDEISMQEGLLFADSLKDLKNLRTQMYSAAEYFELSYTNDDQKQIVVGTLKDYALKALVNTVDHLGSVTDKVNGLLDEKVEEVSGTELRVSCIEQRLRTCQEYIDREGLSQQSSIISTPRYHKRYILPVGDTINGAKQTHIKGCSLNDEDDWFQFRSAIRATVRETPLSTRKALSPSPSPRLSRLPGTFSFSSAAARKELDKRTVSPHRFPLPRSGSLATRPTTPKPIRPTTPNPALERQRLYPSVPMKSASMRVHDDKGSVKEIERQPSKSKRLLKALLSRRKSKKDDMLYTYLDEY
ncbi:Protein abil3 [Ancistrocladus abbreviatus]